MPSYSVHQPNRYQCKGNSQHSQICQSCSYFQNKPIVNKDPISNEMQRMHQQLEYLQAELLCARGGGALSDEVQLINYGVPEEIIEKMKADIEEFFRLALEEKKANSQLPNNIEGYGQAFVVSEEQKLDWADMLFLLSLPTPQRNMTFWPNYPSSFRINPNKGNVTYRINQNKGNVTFS